MHTTFRRRDKRATGRRRLVRNVDRAIRDRLRAAATSAYDLHENHNASCRRRPQHLTCSQSGSISRLEVHGARETKGVQGTHWNPSLFSCGVLLDREPISDKIRPAFGDWLLELHV